jgi:diguanylate cyclase (GGDEF)-like protein
MYEEVHKKGPSAEYIAGDQMRIGESADSGAVGMIDCNVQELRKILSGGPAALLRLPATLEVGFRRHFRIGAAKLLRKSVFGLMALYLLVVLPVGIFTDSSEAGTLWFYYAVVPIGVVLAAILLVTRIAWMDRYVEVTLGISVFVCLSGTIFASMLLGNSFLGQVAALETIYVLFIAFSVLRLSTLLALRGAVSAFLLATAIALFMDIAFSWLLALLYFFVPLLICAINGCMLEYAARRDYIQMLCSRQEQELLLGDLQALEAEGDDLHRLLHFSLGRICTHMGWVAGRALQATERSPLQVIAYYPHGEHESDWTHALDSKWPLDQASALSSDVMQQGCAGWRLQSVYVDAQRTVTHLAFPVVSDGKAIAVLEFFSVREETPDAAMISLLSQVGQQLVRIFERDAQQQKLQTMATHDGLTGLPNRSHLLTALQHALQERKGNGRYQFALLFIDVDRFKWVNDSLGHLAGDSYLAGFARRLRRALGEQGFIARVGGDEFSVLIEGENAKQVAIDVVERVQKELQVPVSLDGHHIAMSASIGIAFGENHHQLAEELLREADTAMSHAKLLSRGGYAVFTDAMHERVRHRLKMTTELKAAIDADALILHYQPIVCLQSGRLSGFEALVRWPHPELGLLQPDQFIALAEETGLILPMTRGLIRQAAQQLSQWRSAYAHSVDLSVSVNVCAAYFSDEKMPQEVMKVIRQSGLSPDSLRLEITETQIIENADACMRNIQQLHDAGVKVYIDDFGTGYSSLSYLTSFRVGSLKIDRSFLTNLPADNSDAIVVKTITSLGHNLGMDVIAEGVETIAQLNYLKELGCQYAQGFLLSRPLAPDAAATLIGLRLIDAPTVAAGNMR